MSADDAAYWADKINTADRFSSPATPTLVTIDMTAASAFRYNHAWGVALPLQGTLLMTEPECEKYVKELARG